MFTPLHTQSIHPFTLHFSLANVTHRQPRGDIQKDANPIING